MDIRELFKNQIRHAKEHEAIHDRVAEFVMTEIAKLNINSDPLVREYLNDMFTRMSDSLLKAGFDINLDTTAQMLGIVRDSIKLHILLHRELAEKQQRENVEVIFEDVGGSKH